MNDYESFKKAYSQGTDAQKESRERRFGNNENYRNFKAQWEQEQNPQPQLSNPAPVQNQFQNQTFDGGSTYNNQVQNNQNNDQRQPSYDPNETLDQSRFTNPNAQVRVQEGRARQTGQPDYQMESEARDNEIINNLNSYKVSNPEFFRDRETFNRSFNYGVRNARQQAVLDSFWIRKQDSDKISNYTTADSISEGIKNADLTKNQLNLLREQYPDLYKQWQDKEREITNLRIVNKTVPTDPTDTAHLFNNLVEKLNLQSGQPYNFVKRWEDALEKYAITRDSERLMKMQDQIYNTYDQIGSLESKIRAQSSGASESLIQARIQKATSSMYGHAQALQQGYSTILQGRSQNIALASQDLQALAQQANEDQRIFNQKLSGLGFAMQTASFETPEQKRARDFAYREKTQNAQIDLKRKEKEMEAEVSSSMYDLSVTDPKKLRSNLFNTLSSYYKQYGNIIQRSQSGVVDDIINYAKQHKVSIAEAMRKNFIEPLQEKGEYKKLMNKEYGISNETPKDVIATYNGESVIASYDQNGHIKLSSPLTNQTIAPQSGSGMKGAGLRNNNPGNIKDQTFGSPIGVDARGFAQFATPEDGFDALVEKIKFNQTSTRSRYYGKTIAQYFQLYAPSSDGNNPKGYAQEVANRLGVSVNTPISKVDSVKFAAAIAHHDSGYNYETYGKFRGANTGIGNYSEQRKGAYEHYIRTRQDPSSTELKSMKISLDQFYNEVASYKQATGYNPLSNDQMSQLNQMSNSFQANAQVKAFEESYSQGLSLLSSLNNVSGPGDVSAVFQFMKTLDPSSVVREGEFETAARSAGVWTQWRNMFNKLNSGQLLSQEQRRDFGKLAKQFVLNKAKIYDTKYNDLTRKLKMQGIPEDYRPTNMADAMRETLGVKNYNLNFTQESSAEVPQDTTDYSKMQSIAPKPNYSSNYSSVVGGMRPKK